jgi:hypothetical protein
LIRNPHGETIADDFKFGPTDEKFVDPQWNVAGVVAGTLDNRASGERKKVSDGKPHNGHLEAESAWKPRHAVERIDGVRRLNRADSYFGIRFLILDCGTHWAPCMIGSNHDPMA